MRSARTQKILKNYKYTITSVMKNTFIYNLSFRLFSVFLWKVIFFLLSFILWVGSHCISNDDEEINDVWFLKFAHS